MFRCQTWHSITSCAAKSRTLPTCSTAPPRGWRSSSALPEAGQSQTGHPRAGISKRNTLQVSILGVARGYNVLFSRLLSRAKLKQRHPSCAEICVERETLPRDMRVERERRFRVCVEAPGFALPPVCDDDKSRAYQ